MEFGDEGQVPGAGFGVEEPQVGEITPGFFGLGPKLEHGL